MSSLNETDSARIVARARERFLEAGVTQLPVRSGIVESWQRSRLSGVDTDLLKTPYLGTVDPDSRLMRAAKPVLDRLEDTLADTAMSVILTDRKGCVLDRRAGQASLNGHLDRVMLAPGFSYAEEHIGTNGIGTAIERRRPCYVFGSEHFSERLQTVACAGAPINNPLTNRLAGLLDITCWLRSATPLMSALVNNAAGDIEQRLLDLGSERERALLTEFMASCKRGNQAIITVSDNLTMTNQQAANLLEPLDYSIVHDKIDELLRSHDESRDHVLLSGGQRAALRCRPIATDAGTAGAVVEINLVADARPASRSPVPPPELKLAGHSAIFRRVCTELTARRESGTWSVVAGEPGVGKRTLVEAVHRRCTPGGSLAVIEPEELAEDTGWARMESAEGREHTVVLCHPERLRPDVLSRVRVWMDSLAERPDRPWVVATTDDPDQLDAGLLRVLPVTVTVPPLRHRSDDVPEIVSGLLRTLRGGRPVSCGAAAMRVLVRAPWPGNIAELAQTLRSALSRRQTGEIQPNELPASCYGASRHALTAWETLERDTIVRALREAHGDKAAAAQVLGISRATIYRKINSYGIGFDLR